MCVEIDDQELENDKGPKAWEDAAARLVQIKGFQSYGPCIAVEANDFTSSTCAVYRWCFFKAQSQCPVIARTSISLTVPFQNPESVSIRQLQVFVRQSGFSQ